MATDAEVRQHGLVMGQIEGLRLDDQVGGMATNAGRSHFHLFIKGPGVGTVEVLQGLLLMANPATTDLPGIPKRVLGMVTREDPVCAVTTRTAEIFAEDRFLIQCSESPVEKMTFHQIVMAIQTAHHRRWYWIRMRQIILVQSGVAITTIKTLVRRSLEV